MSLFRKQAIPNQQSLYGDVVLAAPVPMWWLTALVSVIALGAAMLVLFGGYARKETVSGWLAPSAGLARIAAPAGATVEAVHVANGQFVAKGAPLVTLSMDRSRVAGPPVSETLLTSLGEERDALLSRLGSLPERAAADKAQLAAKRSGLEAELVHIRAQAELQDDRIRIALQQAEQTRTLVDRGFGSRLELQRREADVLVQRQSLQSLEQRAGGLISEIAQVRAEGESVTLDRGEEAADLRQQLAALEQRRASTEIGGRYVLSAPVAGRVGSILAQVGETSTGERALMTILPGDGVLEARLFAPTRAAGFLRRGQEVRLLYDSFPYQRFGAHRGVVTEVSRTILRPQDLELASPGQESVYQVTVAIDGQSVEAYGETFPLQPGMSLKADIILDRRRIWEWMLDPFFSAARRN